MKIELLDYFGGDINHANVARVSYAKEAKNYSHELNERLIKFLVKHKHTSPFRHSTLQFRVKCPIYVERQIFKHQVGISVNSISGRYVDFSDTYHEIKEWRTQSKSSKQGSGEPLSNSDNHKCLKIQENIIQSAKHAYDDLIKLGVSKEQARTILPLSLQTEFIWTGSFLAFIHLCDLRLKSDTQKETRDLVKSMLDEVIKIENNPFKISLKAFGY